MAGVLRGIVERLTGIVLGITSTGGTITVTPNSSTGIINLEVAGGGSGITLETDGTPNTLQTTLNLITGSNVTLTPDAFGGVTIAASGSGGTVTSVTGTTNRITSTGGTTPVIDISASYVGQSSITTLGTIGTGTWQGTKVGLAYGGTNADLSATGGTSQVLKQVSSGAAVTVAQLAASDLSNGTTGSGGGVVLATGPTMSNPVVGTQTSSDNSTKAASTAYVTTAVTNALNGLDWKPAVGYATTANVVGTNTAGVFTYTATGVDTIDGHQLALNDVVLFKNQTTGADNGVWVVTTAGALGVAGVLTRRSDYNTAADIQPGDTFYVINGTVNGGTAWVQTDVVTTINTDPLAFSQVAGPGTYVAGTGLTLTGNSFSVNASQTQVTGVGTLTAGAIGSGFTAITNAALANSTISGISLGSNLDTLTFGTHLAAGGSSYNGSAGVTITSDATNANTVSTIVARDASGNFSAGTITANLTGTASAAPLSGITGLGTGVATALGDNVGSAGAVVVNGGALGTPSSGTATNLTGTASGLTAGTVTTNANLTGDVTSSGNATTVAKVGGIAVQSYVQGYSNGFQNQFRNPIMEICQRSPSGSVSSAAGVYTVDGWMLGSDGTHIISWLQESADGAEPPNSNVILITGVTGNTDSFVQQRIESYLAAQLAGQQVTITFRISNSTGGSLTPQLSTSYATAADNFGAQTADLAATNMQAVPNNTFATVSYSYQVSASAYNGLQVRLDFGALNSGSTQVQLMGADIRVTPGVSTGLVSNPPAIEIRPSALELTFNQRYFLAYGATTGIIAGLHSAGSTTLGGVFLNFPASMRIAPTGIAVTTVSDFEVVSVSAANLSTPSAIAFEGASPHGVGLKVTTTGLTSDDFYFLQVATGSAGNLAITGAEL